MRFRIGAAVGMGLTWAVPAWIVGMGIELIHNVWPNPPNVPLWQITAGLAGPLMLGSAVAASGTLWLARWAEDRERLDPGEEGPSAPAIRPPP